MFSFFVLYVIFLVFFLLKGLSWVLEGIQDALLDLLPLEDKGSENKIRLSYKDLLGRLAAVFFIVIGIFEARSFHDHYLFDLYKNSLGF